MEEGRVGFEAGFELLNSVVKRNRALEVAFAEVVFLNAMIGVDNGLE